MSSQNLYCLYYNKERTVQLCWGPDTRQHMTDFRWENSLLHTRLCSRQNLKCTSAMFKMPLNWTFVDSCEESKLKCKVHEWSVSTVYRKCQGSWERREITAGGEEMRRLHGAGSLRAEHRCLSQLSAGDYAEEITRGGNVLNKSVTIKMSWICSGFT